MLLMKRGTSFHPRTRQGLLSMSGPWQRFPSPHPTVTGSASVRPKLFSQYSWAAPDRGIGKTSRERGVFLDLCLPFAPGTHTQAARPLVPACREPGCSRKAWGLTFRAALWTDNKSGPEGGLGALLRTDFPPSCGSFPQTIFESEEQKRTPSP